MWLVAIVLDNADLKHEKARLTLILSQLSCNLQLKIISLKITLSHLSKTFDHQHVFETKH